MIITLVSLLFLSIVVFVVKSSSQFERKVAQKVLNLGENIIFDLSREFYGISASNLSESKSEIKPAVNNNERNETFSLVKESFLEQLDLQIFLQSLNVNPSLRYQLLGIENFEFSKIEKSGINLLKFCYDFRNTSNSISSDSFDKNVKYDFLDKAKDFGLFQFKFANDFENVNDAATNKSSEKLLSLSELKLTLGYFYCRDALRICGSVLDSTEIAWLLSFTPEIILYNDALLSELRDFSPFLGEHLIAAAENGYDWFSNSIALRTIRTTALLDFIGKGLNYELSLDQLNKLNEIKPISDFVHQDEFFWQSVVDTPYFQPDTFINVPAIVNRIESLKSSTTLYDEDINISTVLINYYIHSEAMIMSHLFNAFNTILSPGLEPLFVLVTLNYFVKMVSMIFAHRNGILNCLMRKFYNLEAVDSKTKLIIALLATPMKYEIREALLCKEMDDIIVKNHIDLEHITPATNITMALDSDIDWCLLNSICQIVRGSNLPNSISIILSLIEITKGVKAPYRRVKGDPVQGIKYMITQFSPLFDEEMNSKWSKKYFIHQAIDSKFMLNTSVDSETFEILFQIIKSNSCFHELDALMFSNLFPESFSNFEVKTAPLNANVRIMETLMNMTTEFERTDLLRLESRVQRLNSEELISFLKKIFTSNLNIEIGLFLSREQIQHLLSTDAGVDLLKSYPKALLECLPTYEDFKAIHLKHLKDVLKMDKLRFPTTVTAVLSEFIFKYNDKVKGDFVLENPIAFYYRSTLATWFNSTWITENGWKFISFRMIHDAYVNEQPVLGDYLISLTTELFKISTKNIFDTGALMKWVIMQEIRFLEAFQLTIMEQERGYCERGYGTLLDCIQKFMENDRLMREKLIRSLQHATGLCFDESKKQSCTILLSILMNPVSELVAGATLVGHGVILPNFRLIHFKGILRGFPEWASKHAFVPINSDYTELGTEHQLSKWSYILREECKDRQNFFFKLLKILYDSKGRKTADLISRNRDEFQLWLSRIKLLSVVSFDGFLLNPEFSYVDLKGLLSKSDITLPLNERIALVRAFRFAERESDLLDLSSEKELEEKLFKLPTKSQIELAYSVMQDPEEDIEDVVDVQDDDTVELDDLEIESIHD